MENMENNRWMPPSPHKEAVLDFLKKGRAHIEERGHNIAPLIVFEDGGVMELPLVRSSEGGNFSPAEGVASSRQTNYVDVCGNINELKKLLEEKPEMAQSSPTRLFELAEDACYLLSRMQERREKYKEFATAVSQISERMGQIGGPNVENAYHRKEELLDFLKNSPEKVAEKLKDLHQMAEDIRAVGNHMEQTLYAYRDMAIELGELYAQIKGSREWKKKKGD